MYKIYKLTTPDGKVYIGKTSLRLTDRWNRGRNYSKNTAFFNAIVKYGWDNIAKEVLHETEDEAVASNLEIEEILKHKSNDRNFGYNRNIGNRMSEEQKRKQSERQKGKEPYWCKPFCHTPEFEAKRHKTILETGCMKGRFVGAKSPRSQSVSMFTLSGQLIKSFGACTDAQRETGIDYGSIVKVCRGKRKSAGGYYWQYAE